MTIEPIALRAGAVTLEGRLVGGLDQEVIRLNRLAQSSLIACRSDMIIVPGATHLFEEPGALERVASLATAWFSQNLDAA